MNPNTTAFMRNFINDVKRCDEMERKLRFLIDQLKKEDDFEAMYGEGVTAMGNGPQWTLDQLEGRLEVEEQELVAANASSQLLERNRNELVELKYVLEKDEQFFFEAAQARVGGARDRERQERDNVPLLADDGMDGQQDDLEPQQSSQGSRASLSLGFITGVVEASKFLSFERVLWRATRGNLYMRHSEVDEDMNDTATGEYVKKNVFIIFYQGSRVEAKIRKICEAFKASLYPRPENAEERNNLLREVDSRLNEVEVVLRRGTEVRRNIFAARGIRSSFVAGQA